MGYFAQLEDKEQVLFLGLMEFGWEIMRWAKPVIKYVLTHPNQGHIIVTLADRVDFYAGMMEDNWNVIVMGVVVEGMYTTIRPECWRLIGYDYEPVRSKYTAMFPNAYLIEPPPSPMNAGKRGIEF